jgi:spermidine synthase|tara:strand:+ start:3887 stop:4543 length:657 start_codon:yes stop_codon:yes gene_type:complete
MSGLIFEKDITNKNIILDPNHNNYQVMMEWEKPYMKALVKNLKPKGHVLEIGFGLGYSATEIQKHKIKSHTIIESDFNVINKLKLWAKKQKHKVIIIEGTWQNKLNRLGKFDSIFFDDTPFKEQPDHEEIRVYNFYHQIAERHVNKNSKMTWYLDRPIYWISHPYTDWNIKEFKIKPPKHCEYTKNNVMFLPLLSFKKGVINNLKKLIITKNFDLKKL